MKKLSLDQIKSRLAHLAKAHDKQEKVTLAKAKRERWEYSPRKFKSAIPFRPRLQQFKTTNNMFDATTMVAYSYNWWRYLEVIKGKLVFNDYSYSNQTRQHQSNLRHLLEQLGITIDLEVEVPGGLQSFETQALPYLVDKIIKLEVAINNKRSNPKVNAERKKEIARLLKQAKVCRSLGAKLSKQTIAATRKAAFAKEAERVNTLETQAKTEERYPQAGQGE